jgi:hypothetical protein
VSIGKWVSSKINPFADPNNILQNNNNSLDGTARILDAAAIQYKDNWLLNCDCSMKNSNPYSTGERGAWRAFRSFTYLTDRQEELVINKPNQRNDGIFKKFENFWQAGTNTGQFAVPVKYVPDNLPESDLSVAKGWGFTAQVTKIDPQGFELENRDALGRYSSEFNGYNSKLVVATAANAQHREVGTTNIEDLKKAACGSLRFFKAPVPPAAPPYSVNDAETNLANGDTLTAHSGKVSIVLKSGEIVQWKQRICSDKYKQPTLSQNGQNPQRTTKKQ